MGHTVRLSPEIAKQIKQITLRTKRLLRSTLVGDTRSARKGIGFEFDQIREYQQGDDIRFIDWHASARFDTLLVKEYREERSRTIVLAVDVSGSSFWGSKTAVRHEIMAQVASVLALVAEHGNDYVGLLLFSDTVHEYMPPRRGRKHVRQIMELLFSYPPQQKKTRITVALQHLVALRKKDALVCILSDFIDIDFKRYLQSAARLYDLVAIRCLETTEQKMPAVGLLIVEDNETGLAGELPASFTGVGQINRWLQRRIATQNALFHTHGVDLLEIVSNRAIIPDIVRFFARRMQY